MDKFRHLAAYKLQDSGVSAPFRSLSRNSGPSWAGIEPALSVSVCTNGIKTSGFLAAHPADRGV